MYADRMYTHTLTHLIFKKQNSEGRHFYLHYVEKLGTKEQGFTFLKFISTTICKPLIVTDTGWWVSRGDQFRVFHVLLELSVCGREIITSCDNAVKGKGML